MATTTKINTDDKRALLQELLRKRAAESRAVYPLSHGQRSLWFMQQMHPQSATYNEAFAWRIASAVDAEALRRAFQGILDRHPTLRTTYLTRGGKPMQQVQRLTPLAFEQVDGAGWTLEQIETFLTDEAHRPFDLERDPTLRVTLVSRSATEHVLLLVMHHIAMDLWSLDVILEDLRYLFAAEKIGMAPKVIPQKRHYLDFVRWQAGLLKSEAGDKMAHYWEEQLAGPLPELQLPTDRPRPAVQTHHGSAHNFYLDDKLTARLRNLANAEGASLFMTVLAGFQVLLHRYSGQDDILVGTPTAGRVRPEWRNIVGYFVNPVVLRANLAGNPTFTDFLGQVKGTVRGALENQDYPFPLLVERLQLPRDPSRTPLFQANFAWEKPSGGVEGGAFKLHDLVLEPFPFQQQTTKFDLTLMVMEGQWLHCTLQYNTDLFDAATIERMAGHLQTLLAGIVENPQTPIGELPMLTIAEKQIQASWHSGVSCPTEPMHRLIEKQVEITPDAIAVVMGPESLTYRELNEKANQLAHHLRSLGVGPEFMVGLCLERSLDTVVSILGILKAGGAYVPLDLAYPKDRLAFMIDDAGIKLLLTKSHLLSEMPLHKADVLLLDRDGAAISEQSKENPESLVSSDSLAYVIFTSGSTGKPKGVLVTHRGIGNLAQAQIKMFEVTPQVVARSPDRATCGPVARSGDRVTTAVKPQSRVLQFASLSFDASVSEMAMALIAGATLVLAEPEAMMGPGLVRLLQEQAITTVTLPPSLVATLAPEDLPGLRTLAVAGEACPAEVVTRWAPGRKFINAYGPTENTVCASMAECKADGSKPSIGKPMENVEVLILDKNRQPVPVGVPGEIYLGGIGLARGYMNRPELTAERFVAHPFQETARLYRTGDLARWLPDGNIDFLGRIDHQVKIRGFRIELGEIEAALNQHPAIGDTVVLAREDEPGKKRLVAYFVAGLASAPSVSELRRFLKEMLPEYMIPAAFVRLDAYPLSPNGKVDRKAVPAPDTSRPELEQAFIAPETPVQIALAQIWAQVLGVEKVGILDNFFELGGASIQTLQVVERAQARGMTIAPEMMFQYQTIAELEAAAGLTCVLPAAGAA
jgi:amino acid adenylation domain-containing protein